MQSHIQGFELVVLKIYTSGELLYCTKGPILLILCFRISVTKRNSRIARWHSSEDPILIVWQKPESLDKSKDSLKWLFASGDVWTEGNTFGHTVTQYNFHNEKYFLFPFVLFCFVWFSFWREGCKGEGQIWEGQRDERTGVHDVKHTHKKNQEVRG